jgi:hypothetical protein
MFISGQAVTYNYHCASDILQTTFTRHTLKNSKMKKIISILALVLTVSTTFAFSGPEAVSSQALNTFSSEYIGANDATWTISKDFYQVAFTLDGQRMFAFYTKSGDFIAVTQNISSVHLPNSLKKSLKKLMGNRWITDLFEVTHDNETSWYVTLESADQKIVLKSNGGKWRIYQNMEKKETN